MSARTQREEPRNNSGIPSLSHFLSASTITCLSRTPQQHSSSPTSIIVIIDGRRIREASRTQTSASRQRRPGAGVWGGRPLTAPPHPLLIPPHTHQQHASTTPINTTVTHINTATTDTIITTAITAASDMPNRVS
eukprot:2496435-Rhodomonas_salina.1